MTNNQNKIAIFIVTIVVLTLLGFLVLEVAESRRDLNQLKEDIKNIQIRYEIEEQNSKLNFDELLDKLH